MYPKILGTDNLHVISKSFKLFSIALVQIIIGIPVLTTSSNAIFSLLVDTLMGVLPIEHVHTISINFPSIYSLVLFSVEGNTNF